MFCLIRGYPLHPRHPCAIAFLIIGPLT